MIRNAPLGIPEFERNNVIRGTRIYLTELQELQPIDPNNEKLKGGSAWSAWVEDAKRSDFSRIPDDRKTSSSKLFTIEQQKIVSLPVITGLASMTSFDHLENGLTDGHVRSQESSLQTDAAVARSNVYWENLFPQYADSNQGAWRSLEMSMIKLRNSEHYETINFGGPVWKDVEYKALNGQTKRAKSQLLWVKDSWFGVVYSYPVPAAYWRFTIIVPRKDANGYPISLSLIHI